MWINKKSLRNFRRFLTNVNKMSSSILIDPSVIINILSPLLVKWISFSEYIFIIACPYLSVLRKRDCLLARNLTSVANYVITISIRFMDDICMEYFFKILLLNEYYIMSFKNVCNWFISVFKKCRSFSTTNIVHGLYEYFYASNLKSPTATFT